VAVDDSKLSERSIEHIEDFESERLSRDSDCIQQGRDEKADIDSEKLNRSARSSDGENEASPAVLPNLGM
jgi:hypothetical protein